MLRSCRSLSSTERKTHLFLNQKFSWHNICTDFSPLLPSRGQNRDIVKSENITRRRRSKEAGTQNWEPTEDPTLLRPCYWASFFWFLCPLLPLAGRVARWCSFPICRCWTIKFGREHKIISFFKRAASFSFFPPKSLCSLINLYIFWKGCLCFPHKRPKLQHLEKPSAHSDRLALSLTFFHVFFYIFFYPQRTLENLGHLEWSSLTCLESTFPQPSLHIKKKRERWTRRCTWPCLNSVPTCFQFVLKPFSNLFLLFFHLSLEMVEM